MYRPGANTELGGFGLPDSFGVTGDRQRAPHRLALRGDQRAAHLHDLVPVPRARRRLRRRRRREPARLGRALARGAGSNLTATMLLPSPTKLSPSYRVWGNPAWVRGVVARAPDRATLQAVQVPAHQFVEHRVRLPAGPAHVDRGRAGPARERARPDRRGGARRRSATTSRTSEKIDDAKEHPGRTLLLLLVLGLGPALGLIGLVWLFYGRERADRLRPRVRAGAADRDGAGPRPVARAGRRRRRARTSSPRRSSTSSAAAATRRRRSRPSAPSGAAFATRTSPTSSSTPGDESGADGLVRGAGDAGRRRRSWTRGQRLSRVPRRRSRPTARRTASASRTSRRR